MMFVGQARNRNHRFVMRLENFYFYHRDRNIKTLECVLLLFDQYEVEAPPAPFC